MFEKTKQIYLSLPKGRDEILGCSLDFAAMQPLNLLEKVVRPWVAKKIKELLGVEEQAMINLVVGHLKSGSATSESMMTKVSGILDEDSEQFVLKLWQVLIFEHLKVKGGIYNE
jgi:RNA-binding protein 25